MPSAVTLLLAFAGLVGVTVGILASRANKQFLNHGTAPRIWPTLIRIARVSGVIIGLASWPLTFWMGYPIATPNGVGRIVGIPFFVAFFDSAGHDYVGPLTILGIIGNCLFWAHVPEIFLFGYGHLWRRKHRVSA